MSERNVLSLFDGMSCLQIVLTELGIHYDNYFASEVEKEPIRQTMHNFPNTIQLGDVRKIKHKVVLLPEAYSYICRKYFRDDVQDIQGRISKREMLYRINKEQNFAAYFGTQKQNEVGRAHANTSLSVNDRVWFFKNKVGDIDGTYDIIRGGSRRKSSNTIDVGELCKHSFWWNGNGQQESEIKRESFSRINGTRGYKINKREVKSVRKTTVFKRGIEKSSERNGFTSISRPYKKKKLHGSNKKTRQGFNNNKEKSNRRKKKADAIRCNEMRIRKRYDYEKVIGDNRLLLRIYNKIQVTIIECEWGVIVTKGLITENCAGSPCQSFSFAGKRAGMSTVDKIEVKTLEHYLQLKTEKFEFEGQSYLFWEFMRILEDVRKYNPNVIFFLENVEMGKKWEGVLSRAIGCYPQHIDSARFSAQHRKRLYWTSISQETRGMFGEKYTHVPLAPDKRIYIKDIIDHDVPEKYYLSDKMMNWLDRHSKKRGSKIKFKNLYSKASTLLSVEAKVNLDNDFIKEKAGCLTAGGNSGGLHSDMDLIAEVVGCDLRSDEGLRIKEDGKSGTLCARARNDESCGQLLLQGYKIRRFTPNECSKLQSIPFWYKFISSDTAVYKMLGNGWEIEAVKQFWREYKRKIEANE